MNEFRWHCEYSPTWQQYHLWIIKGDKVMCLQERETDQDARGSRQPSVPMSYGDAQELMDAMWHAGLRPSDLRGVEGGQIAAVKDEVIGAMNQHIDDLRKAIK